MALTNEKMENSFKERMKDMEVKIRSGSSIVLVKPLFSYDSKCLIIASGPVIKIYNVKSCECLHVLRYHKTDVISLQENKSNCLQFYSCSEDGVIVKWEVVHGSKLKVFHSKDDKCSLKGFYAPSKDPVFYYIKKKPDIVDYRLYSYNSANRQSQILNPVLPSQEAVSFGFEGSFVAAIFENRLQIFKFSSKEYVKHLTGTSKLQCVVCHPTDLCLATGDDKGKIILWSNIFDGSRPIRSIFHWHTLPVADIAFSTTGSYLYSGGGEAVLVKWNLLTSEKSYLPRMGAPISHLKESPDSSYVAVCLEENSLHIIDPHRQVTGLIQGLSQKYHNRNPGQNILSTGLLYDPQTKCLVFNGKPGHLQFYSLLEDKHLFDLDISAKNFISNERESINYNIDVTKAAIDEKGQWLATVEYWCNKEVSPMIWLKFWEYSPAKLNFIMNTSIYMPHSKKVNCIIFRPYDSSDTLPLAVTTSEDCRFKTWVLQDDSSLEGKQSWNCASMDYYREDLPTGDASFSEDGTVLAMAVKNIVTIWTDNNAQLEATLFQEKETNPIKQLKFGRFSCKHLLVCHDGSKIIVWNVLSLSITFTINVAVSTIETDIASHLMAVFCTDADDGTQNLYLFQPSDPVPLFFNKNVCEKPVLSAIFVPKSSENIKTDEIGFPERSELLFFNEDQWLLSITDETEDDFDTSSQKNKMNTNVPLTPFGYLQAEQKISDVKEIEQKSLPIQHIDSSKDSLDYPNPTYVNHFAICSKVLRSLLQPRSTNELPPESKKENENETKKTKEIKIEDSENLSNKFDDLKLNITMDSLNPMDSKTENLVTDYSFLKEKVTFKN